MSTWSRDLVSTNQSSPGDESGDVLLLDPGLHGVDPLGAEEGRLQTQRVLLPPHGLQVGHVNLLRLKHLKYHNSSVLQL